MLDRNEDMRTTGTRHPYLGRYKVNDLQLVKYLEFLINFIYIIYRLAFLKMGSFWQWI